MLYADRFAGHLDPDDVRTPVYGAGGCTWPTIPAWKYYLASSNAYGIFAPLTSQGILLESSDLEAHDDHEWHWVSGPTPPFYNATMRKIWYPASLQFQWRITLHVTTCGAAMEWIIDEDIRKCNYNIPLTDRTCGTHAFSGTGSHFTAYQVEWDSSKPPGGWPIE